MKRVLAVIVSIAALSGAAYAGKNNNKKPCQSDFMYDPCPVGSYSVVESEEYHKGRHNWMAVGDTLDTDISTGGVGAEKRRNLPREAYIFPDNTSTQCDTVIYAPKHKKYHRNYEDQHPRVVKSDCDTPRECKN